MVKFGWCLDELHEGCKDSYTIMWPPVNDFGPKRGKKEKVVQEERLVECSCGCHGRSVGSEATAPRPSPKPAPKKKKASRSRQ